MVQKRTIVMNKQLALAIKLNDEATLADFNWGANQLLKQQLNTIMQIILYFEVDLFF